MHEHDDKQNLEDCHQLDNDETNAVIPADCCSSLLSLDGHDAGEDVHGRENRISHASTHCYYYVGQR